MNELYPNVTKRDILRITNNLNKYYIYNGKNVDALMAYLNNRTMNTHNKDSELHQLRTKSIKLIKEHLNRYGETDDETDGENDGSKANGETGGENNTLAEQIEQGAYDYISTLYSAPLSNAKSRGIYLSIVRMIIANISLTDSDTFRNRVIYGIYPPYILPFMSHQDMYPNKWINHIVYWNDHFPEMESFKELERNLLRKKK